MIKLNKKKLIQALVDKNFSVVSFAKAAKLSPVTVMKILHETEKVTLQTLTKICAALGVGVGELLAEGSVA